MSDAIFQRSLEASSKLTSYRPLPLGYGLLIGAAFSLALWAGLIWLMASLMG